MAKESTFLMMWQIFFAIISAIAASQNVTLQNTSLQNPPSCPRNCSCSPCLHPANVPDLLAIQCSHVNLDDFTDLSFADKICSLDLSGNSIENISSVVFKNMTAAQNLTLSYNLIKFIPDVTFEGLKSLKFLFLEHNKIEIITEKAFNGLTKLEYLNLAYNDLREWRGIISSHLPKLQFLNIMGNSKFKLLKTNKRLLRDAVQLKTIVGATLTTKGCMRCNFSQIDVPRKVLIKPKVCEYIPPYNMPLIEKFQKKYLYFNGTCPTKTCVINLVPMHKVRKTYRNYCWERGRSLRPIEYFLGAVAMAFNLVIIATIICSRFLIKKTSMLLTAQLAFGDLCLAVFSLAIASGHGIMSDADLRKWRENLCPYFRSLLILGQTIEAFTSALMTLERYLVIVYCMRPHLRVSSRTACFLCAFSLIFGASSCYVIDRFDNPLIRDNFMCVLIQNFRTTKRILASQILMLLFVAIYLAVVAMYIHIYIFVRRTAQSAGIQRETTLAKRISIIVFSNMLFYAVPNLSIVVFSAGDVRLLSDSAVDFVLRLWLPPMCMVTNACLNPFLFAFRNEEFLKSLQGIVRKIIPRACLVKALPLVTKVQSKGGLYVVNGGEQGQNSSQLTLNESIELNTT